MASDPLRRGSVEGGWEMASTQPHHTLTRTPSNVKTEHPREGRGYGPCALQNGWLRVWVTNVAFGARTPPRQRRRRYLRPVRGTARGGLVGEESEELRRDRETDSAGSWPHLACWRFELRLSVETEKTELWLVACCDNPRCQLRVDLSDCSWMSMAVCMERYFAATLPMAWW